MTITNVKTGVLGVDDVYKKTLSEYFTYCEPPLPLTGGNLFAFGYGGFYGNGDCTTVTRSSPIQIPGTWICSNDGGNYTTVLQKSDNTIWGIGYNDGKIWCDGVSDVSSPVQVPGSTWCLAVTGNNNTVHAIKTNNTLWGWGNGGQGGIGNNTNGINYSSPIQIPGTTWCSVHGGVSGNATALKTDGTLWSWGYKGDGDNGDGTNITRSSPVQIPGTTWSKASHRIALKTDGTLWSWGRNGVGDNTSISRSSPVQIPGTTWCKIDGSNGIKFAIKTDGTLWSWGETGAARGNNTATADVSSPVQIPGTTWCHVAVGYTGDAAIALKTDNTLWNWGSAGYTGVNTSVPRSSPVQIPGTWSHASAGRNSTIIRL